MNGDDLLQYGAELARAQAEQGGMVMNPWRMRPEEVKEVLAIAQKENENRLQLIGEILERVNRQIGLVMAELGSVQRELSAAQTQGEKIRESNYELEEIQGGGE